jgi:glycosyltransferase 2 family protein
VKLRVPHSPWVRLVLVLPVAAGVVALLWLRGPNWKDVGDAFTIVRWQWVLVAIAFNLVSVLARALAWRTVIRQAIPPPRPGFLLVFSAFSVGLFANAVLPGRIGELARVAVLNRKLPGRPGAWATLIGTVFAHRIFDLVPVVLLIVYVVLTAKIPSWAVSSLIVFVCVGALLFALALAFARRQRAVPIDIGPVRRLLAMTRQGLGVMRTPLAAVGAIAFQCAGWLCQLFAVYTAMRAFHIHAPLPAAGLVLVLMNVATIFPLWPGNVGLLQAAIALPLLHYGVFYARGIAYGIGLQAIEASVGVGFGLLFLAREGLSYTMLKVMPDATQVELPEEETAGEAEQGADGARARVPG